MLYISIDTGVPYKMHYSFYLIILLVMQATFAVTMSTIFSDAINCNYGLKSSYYGIDSAIGEQYQAIGTFTYCQI